jgi:hypothetical protein
MLFEGLGRTFESYWADLALEFPIALFDGIRPQWLNRFT